MPMCSKINQTLTSRTKSITSRKLPHACKELDGAANEESHAEDDVWDRDAARLDVDEGEDERGGSERE